MIKTMLLIIFILCITSFMYDAAYTDCKSTACSFFAADANPIQAGTIAGSILLPAIFQMSFDVQISSNNNEYPILANLVEIYSITRKQSILRISLAPLSNSNQINIIYNNQVVVDYGPPIIFSPTSFSSLTVTVQEFSVTFASQVWGKTYPIGGALTPGETIVYTSSKTTDATHVSAVGNIQNIVIVGKSEYCNLFIAICHLY